MVEDLVGSKGGVVPHEEHCVPATQRSEEPVSRTTLKVWGGVPTVTWPM